jgi:WD40 repeat protein
VHDRSGKGVEMAGMQVLHKCSLREAATAVAMTDDAKLALAGNNEARVTLWDLSASRKVWACLVGGSEIKSIAMTGDGRLGLAATNLERGALSLWDIKKGERMKNSFCYGTPAEHKWLVETVALSADGKRALTGGLDGVLRKWDIDKDECFQDFSEHEAGVQYVALSANGHRGVSIDRKHKWIHLWDLEEGVRVQGGTGGCYAAALSRGGEKVLVGHDNGYLSVIKWNGLRDCVPAHKAAVSYVAMSGDGKIGLVSSYDGVLSLWDLSDHPECVCRERGPRGMPIAMTPDGAYAVSLQEDIVGWDLVLWKIDRP